VYTRRFDRGCLAWCIHGGLTVAVLLGVYMVD
jgi:hypothetical protein